MVIASTTFLVAACGEKVPTIEDAHAPVVDGVKMSPYAFIEKYCAGEAANKTCVQVQRAMGQDATKGALPKGW